MNFSVCFSLFLLALYEHLCKFVFAAEFGFTVSVPAGRTECYFQPVTDPKHVKMEIMYQVIDGGDMDVNFYVRDMQSVIVATDTRRQENSHRIAVEVGDYELCFDNSFSYQASKTVYFDVFLEDKDGSVDDLQYRDLAYRFEDAHASLEDFRQTSVRIKNNLNKAEQHQTVLRTLEYRDRSVMEGNFDRVNFWSTVNLGVMIFVLLVQVIMVRSLFEDNSKLGKLLRK